MSKANEVAMASTDATKKHVRPATLTAAAVVLILPTLLTFVTLPSWQAVAVLVIAVITALLVLAPPSMKGCAVAPKERRVM